MENGVYASNLPKFKPSSSFTWIIIVVQSLSPIQTHYHCSICSSQSLTVLHYLLEFAEVHAHWVGDAMQPAISFSVIPFSCPQSFPASESFAVSHLFSSSDQSIGDSASVLPMNIQGWFPLGLTGFISLLSKELSRVFSSTTIWKHQFLTLNLLNGPTLKSIYVASSLVFHLSSLCSSKSLGIIQPVIINKHSNGKQISSILLFYQKYFIYFLFFFISWRLIILQYCSGFCHTLTWISHGYTCIPHPDPLSHLPLHQKYFKTSKHRVKY